MHDLPAIRAWLEGGLRRVGLAGSAQVELVSGVVQLRPEDAMVEAMLRGWRAQQVARGLKEDTISAREQLVRRFLDFTNEYPWRWRPSHVDEWSLWMTAERHLAPSTIRGYQTDLRLFTEFLTDNVRYGWVSACEQELGPGVFPVPIVHEWNSIAHLQSYEGNPEARPFTPAQGYRAGAHTEHPRWEGPLMAPKLDYRWHLRHVMASREMFQTTDLIEPLADRGITLSSSQVYRLVTERPERLSLKILMALLDILDCAMDDLIEPVADANTAAKPAKKAVGGGSAAESLGSLRPKRARIAAVDR